MEIYEIIHRQFELWHDGLHISKHTVITATMDKDMAEKMLKIYRASCKMDEAYDMRVIREPEIKEFNFKENGND